MKISKMTILIVGLLTVFPLQMVVAGGGGDLKIGYIYIDEDGNQSVSYPSFNYFEGPAFSLERFGYRLGNGIKFSMDLRNVNLENRNVRLGVSKTGLYGVDFTTNRYVRVYDFDGDVETRRDRSMVKAWVTPSKYIKIFGSGSFNTVSGSRSAVFGDFPGLEAQSLDYMSSRYTFGGDLKVDGKLLHAEYGFWDYTDDIDEDNDQTRKMLRLNALLPLPQYERIVLSGAFRSFETEFESSGRSIESWTVMGAALYKFMDNARLNYIAKLNRAGSSDDLVDTDNLAHMVYLSYSSPKRFGATLGYQYHINDDFEDAIISNSYYLGGWLAPSDRITFKFEQGIRAEEVDEGSRLVGNEDRTRTRIYGTFKGSEQFTLKAGFELKSRENDQIGTSADYDRIYLEPVINYSDNLTLSGGYSLSRGEYENTVNTFEFRTHQVFGNIDIRPFEMLTGGFGIDYFRNEEDLDSEAINLLFRAVYSYDHGLRGELTYRVLNFDDLLIIDKYYTGNIVEFNLIKSFSIN
jgi:hypothetical protein